jgi:DNA-binding CsgD family transcriptional regulator
VNLTPREIEVLNWIATGKSDWQVGQILRISDKTVNFHVENMKRKMGVATRIQVVVKAVQAGKIASVL